MFYGLRIGRHFGQGLNCLTRCTNLTGTPTSNVARRFLQTERNKTDYRFSTWHTKTFVLLSSGFVAGAGLTGVLAAKPLLIYFLLGQGGGGILAEMHRAEKRHKEAEKRKEFRLKEKLKLSNEVTRSIEVLRDLPGAEKAANKLLHEYGDGSGLVMVAKEAANLGNFDLALRVAGNIPLEGPEHVTFEYIAEKILDSGDLDRALEVVHKIPSSYLVHEPFFEYFSEKIMASNDLSNAIEIVNTIPWKLERSYALQYIAKKVADYGDLDKALEIANRISDEYRKSWALEYTVMRVVNSGDLDKALKVANEIPNDDTKSHALACIANKIADSGDYNRSLKIAKSIPDDFSRFVPLERCAEKIADSGEFDRALEIARRIDCRSLRTSAFLHITRKMVDRENFEHVLEMINAIEWSVDNDSDLTYVLERTIEFQGFDQTLELIGKVTSELTRARAFSCIAINAADIKDSEYSLEIADLIPKEYRGLWGPVFEHITMKEADSKNFDRALEIAKKCYPEEESLLCYISCAMADSGELDRALDLAHSISMLGGHREKAINYVTDIVYKKSMLGRIRNNFNQLLSSV